MAHKPKHWALLAVLVMWPLLVGGCLDAIDLAFGDVAAGAAWSFAGVLGIATASAPATLACLLVRARQAHFYSLAGAAAGSVSSAAIIFWRISLPPDPLFGSVIILVVPIVLIGAAFTGLSFWLIRRPDRDEANPDTSAP